MHASARVCSFCRRAEPTVGFYTRSNYCKACHTAYTGRRQRLRWDAESEAAREARLAQRRLKRTGSASRKRVRQVVREDGFLRCIDCDIWKPPDAFYRDKDKSTGRSTRCKTCSLASHQRYYQANRAKLLTYQQERRNAGRDAARAYEREIYERRKDKAQATNKARARAMGKPNAATVGYDRILRSDPCSYCGASAGQVDHVTPIRLSGANHWMNLTAACRACNREKSAWPLLHYLRER